METETKTKLATGALAAVEGEVNELIPLRVTLMRHVTLSIVE